MNKTGKQVSDAIERRLYVMGGIERGRYHPGGASFEIPVGINGDGRIGLQDGDCGLIKPLRWISEKEWKKLSGDGARLWKKVGLWDFVRAEDPAVDCIRRCHADPQGAGRELHRLREEKAARS